MKSLKYILILILFSSTFNSFILIAQETQNPRDTSALGLNVKMPVDTTITIGKLDNGLKYYIRKNHKPENRAELRLVVNAGSVLENDNQQGLAHLVEHMAFNGTKNFEKQEIVDYLESIGMRFGPDINAYTSFDETVYMLQVPTDTAGVVEKGIQILQEWAHNVSFAPEEIDKERGVVIEEWRLGRGAGARIRDQQLPVLFKGSRYAERLPIGKKAVIDTAHYDTIRQFYNTWYRPDLMAVIAVGDFDKKQVQELIKKYFSKIDRVKNAKERKVYPVPGNEKTLFAIATDPEATGSNVSIYQKLDVEAEETLGAYRQLLIEHLYNGMFNNRLNELLKQPAPPFLFAFSDKSRFIRPKEFYILGAAVKDNGIETGLDAIMTESVRVRQYGFTQTELDREKAEMLRGIEQAYKERDKTESEDFASEYTRNFLLDEPIPGIAYEYELYRTFMPGIDLAEVNALASTWNRTENRVILASAPEKKDIEVPTKNDLQNVISEVAEKEIQPYEDVVSDQPLIEKAPTAGQITQEKKIENLGVTEWTLSNGLKVVLKPTDFKNDEILFTAYSPGGLSLISNENYVAGVTAPSIIRESGVGEFDQIALQKKLAGKIVRVSPWLQSLQEGFSGSTTPEDLETLFELIYLYFTSPREDSTAYLSYKSRVQSFIKNRHASPEAAFQDTIHVTMTKHNFRTRPWSEKVLDEMDLQKSFRIYQDRFSDASDFTFFFVGSFDLQKMKPLVEEYLGGLPDIERKETWRDVGIETPKGVVKKEVDKGLEPKSQVSVIFTGPFKWNRQNRYELNSMTDVLRIKLREVLREELSGTYGVRVSPSSSRYPDEEYSINISFGCSPERVQELIDTVFVQIDSLQSFGTTEKYLEKVKETQRRERETDLKENRFWLNALQSYYFHELDLEDILAYDKLVDRLTLEKIQKAAQEYLNEKNYVQVVLYPEDFAESEGK